MVAEHVSSTITLHLITLRLGDKFAFDKMFSDNAPVGVVTFGGEYYCTTEAPFLQKIDPKTLETIGKVSFLPSQSKIVLL